MFWVSVKNHLKTLLKRHILNSESVQYVPLFFNLSLKTSGRYVFYDEAVKFLSCLMKNRIVTREQIKKKRET